MAKPLNILYISHYFPPEVNAPAARVSEMSSRWVRKGARVTVLTGFPNHPTGIIPEKYRGLKRRVEAYDGVKVVRTWMYAAANKGFVKRILNYLSFMFSAIVLGSGKVGNGWVDDEFSVNSSDTDLGNGAVEWNIADCQRRRSGKTGKCIRQHVLIG